MPPRKPKYGDKEMYTELNIPGLENLGLNDNSDSEEDDNTLESELDAILSGQVSQKPKRRPKKEQLGIMDIEKMANECIKDIDMDDDDENSADDEELMDELKALADNDDRVITDSHNPSDTSEETMNTPVGIISTLNERLNLYKEAESAAKLAADFSKLRRYSRAVKTLESQIKAAKSGKPVNEEEIPPLVNFPRAKGVPSAVIVDEHGIPPLKKPAVTLVDNVISPVIPSKPMPVPESLPTEAVEKQKDSKLHGVNPLIVKRRDQYKKAALRAKQAGDTRTALIYVKIAKQIETVMEAEKCGQSIDLSNMPATPPKYSENKQNAATIASTSQQPLLPTPDAETNKDSGLNSIEKAALEAAKDPMDPSLFCAPPPPSNVLEALEQRLEKYHSTKDAAVADGNKSKARRLQRIVQQYEDTIKCYKAGKPVNLEELPIPPGFAPIPLDVTSGVGLNIEPSDTPQEPSTSVKSIHTAPHPTAVEQQKTTQQSAKHHLPVQRSTSTVMDKQLQYLLGRQKVFRQAAFKAKAEGEMQKALYYLRMSKGFDPMIEAAKCGLPVDMSTIPPLPQSEADYVVVDVPEVFENDLDDGNNDKFSILEKDLRHQIELCVIYRNKFSDSGDKESAGRFQDLENESKKRLIEIKYCKCNNEPLPNFHYETRIFSIEQSNLDLLEQDIEITIGKGINLPGKPDSVDCYVKLELPIPNDAPQHAKTHVVYNTNNPVFQETFKMVINRKSRSQLRAFKRHSLKCEVWSKGGFFQKDTLLGIAAIKLVALESKYMIHEFVDVLQGRKSTGGKLEVTMRVRDPLLKKHIEQFSDKWIVFKNA